MAKGKEASEACLELLDLPINVIYMIAHHLDLSSLVSFCRCSSLLYETLLLDDYHGEGTRATCGSKPACSRLWGKLFYERYNRELPLGRTYRAAMEQLGKKVRGGEEEEEESDASSEMTSESVAYENVDVDWSSLKGLERFRHEGKSSFVEALALHLKEATSPPPEGYCALSSVCRLWYASAHQIIPHFWQLWSCGLITSSGQAPTHTHFHPPHVRRFRRLGPATEKELEEEAERKRHKIYRVPCWKRLVIASHIAEKIRSSLFSFTSTSEITVAPEALCSPIVLRARVPSSNTAAAAAGVAVEALSVITGEGAEAVITEVVLRHTMRLGPAAVVNITPMADMDTWKASKRIDRDALQSLLTRCGVQGFSEVTISLRERCTSMPVMMVGSIEDFFVGVGTFCNG